MKLIPPTLLFFLLLLASCQPEPNGRVPADDTYIYSGLFKAIQQPYIEVNGTRYKNRIGDAPIQITAEVKNDNLVFTVYGYDYGIYDVNIFVEHADCFKLNGTEYLDIQTDEHGNDEIRIIFPEDYWKKCYFDDEVEKVVSFVLKAEGAVFRG